MRHDLFALNVQTVHRATPDKHAEALYGLVRWFRPLYCVEIGALHGFTSAWIAQALAENGIGHLWTIDDGQSGDGDLNTLEFNLERLDVLQHVTLLRGNDRRVQWPERVDFAYIDGDHSYDGARWDWDECTARGASAVALHDTSSCEGPARLVEEIRADGGWDVLEDTLYDGFTVCRRRMGKPQPWLMEAGGARL